MPEADRAREGVGLGAELVAAPAEHLGPRAELDVALQPDHGFPLAHRAGQPIGPSRRPPCADPRVSGRATSADTRAGLPEVAESRSRWTSSGARPTSGSRRSTRPCRTLLGAATPVPVRGHGAVRCSAPPARRERPIGAPQWKAAGVVVGVPADRRRERLVVLAERTVPAGIVALIFALVPAVDRALRSGRGRRRLRGWSGHRHRCSASRARAPRGRRAPRGTCHSRGVLLAVGATMSWRRLALRAERPLPQRRSSATRC